MRLVIDMMGAQSASRTRGIGRYSRSLTRALIEESAGHEVILAVCENMTEGAAQIRETFQDVDGIGHIVGYQGLNSVAYSEQENGWRRKAGAAIRDAAFAALEPDVILSLSVFEGYGEDALTSGLVLARPALRVAIAHDVIPLRYPNDYLSDPRVDAWYRVKLAEFAEHDLFLANSDATADDLCSLLGFERDRITTIMAGAEDFDGAQAAPSREVAERFGLNRPYFVYAGSWEPRKNFLNLIDAFGQFKRSTKEDYALVLVTDDAPSTKNGVQLAARKAGLNQSDVVVTGYVGEAELRRLYRDAQAMVYPSLFEGFGLPVLEAMFCDVPVICSGTSSMREIMVLEEAMFNPEDPQDIAIAMARLAEDEAYRARLVAHGTARRQAFSWRESARRSWGAIEKALELHDARPMRREKWVRHHELIRCLGQSTQDPVAPTPLDVVAASEVIASNLEIYEAAPRVPAGPMAWRIEGPVDSSYSLALVNRETVRALARQGVATTVVSSEGGGDFPPNLPYLKDGHCDIISMLRPERDEPINQPLLVSRNMYPPRVSDMGGDFNVLHHCAWEESRYPSAWVDEFNLYLDGATCSSRHVQKVLQDSGVAIPLAISGNGVDHWLGIAAKEGAPWPGKAFRFLHVSSCFPRKGADALLKAFGQAFRSSDDVSLIIKTFRNPHNEIAEQLDSLREIDESYPDVHIIFEDFSPEYLKSLYEHCDVLVAPSRAEGYGLPIAEALISGLPVIATGWSGQLDFCRPEWAWLVDYHFAPAKTHFDLVGSVWAEPDIDDLAAKMTLAVATTAEQRASMAELGREHLLREHTWDVVTQRLRAATDTFIRLKRKPQARLGWVTTWNCPCGIATYSQHFLEQITNEVVVFGAHDDEIISDDEANVVRAWFKNGLGDLSELERAIPANGVEALVVQFNYGFYNFRQLSEFLRRMEASGIPVFIDLHATRDPPDQPERRLATIAEALSCCARVIVHSHHDLNRLKAIGVIDNVSLMPHGIVAGPDASFAPHSGERFVIGSYGFCLPHKGLLQLLEAFALLAEQDQTLELRLTNSEYPADISRQMVRDIEERIRSLGLHGRARLNSTFLNDKQAMEAISACDLLVFPYEATNESASGAVRFGIASGRPVATSRLPIFDDVKDATFQIEAETFPALVDGLGALIASLRAGGETVERKSGAAKRWRESHSYRQIAAQLMGMVQAVLLEKHLADPNGEVRER